MRARERVTRDLFATFHALEKEGIPRALGDAQIGAYGGQQIRGKNVVDRDEVALFGEALEFAEIRLDHGNKFTVPTESPRCSGGAESSIDSFQFTKKETHYYITSGGPGLFARGRGILDGAGPPHREERCHS